MHTKNQTQLVKAKALVYAWKINEAYNIFRRYFDRLPFQPEKEHAEYIGLFVRVLFELGKEFELKFYLGELERLYEKSKNPLIAYPLGVIYSYIDERKMEVARGLFESIIKSPEAKALHPKAKMMLADYFNRKDDIAACRSIVDSLNVAPNDVPMYYLAETWKAIVERLEKKPTAAKERLEAIFTRLTVKEDWYAYFSAKVILAMVYIDEDKLEEANDIVTEVRKLFEGRRFKMVQVQLGELENLLKEKTTMGPIQFVSSIEGDFFVYGGKRIMLKNKSAAERLLSLFLQKGFLDKSSIVKGLYDRPYVPSQDDKLIYYHIHCLRKQLKGYGLPAEALESDGTGYRLIPEVQLTESEL